jgi:hypothetical protein
MADQTSQKKYGELMKRLLVPIIILAVIVLVWLIQSSLEKKKIKVQAIENYLNLNEDVIDKVIVFKPDDSMVLYRENDVWYVQDSFPRKADPQVIDNMLTQSVSMTVENVISRNPEKQADFDVDSVKGMLVQFWGNDQLLNSIIIGKMTRGYTHTYVRQPESIEVYLSTGPLSYVYNRPFTGWLDKNILSMLSGSIESIEFIYPDKAIKLIRKDTSWVISQSPYSTSEPVDDNHVNPILNMLTNLTASDFVNASDSGLVNFEQPSLILNITLFDGNSETITFGAINEDESRRYCRKTGISETYVIMRSRFENLLLDYATLTSPVEIKK